jgi:hypothetical protein
MDGLRYILNREREMELRENKRSDKLFKKLKNFEKKHNKQIKKFENTMLSLYTTLNRSLGEIEKNINKKNE